MGVRQTTFTDLRNSERNSYELNMKNDLKGKMQGENHLWHNVDFAFTKIYKKVSCKWHEEKKG